MPDDVLPPSAGPKDERPVPDPTSLTTQALYREVGQLREYIEAQMDGESKLTNAKFVALSERLDRVEDQRKEHKVDSQTSLRIALENAEKTLKEALDAREKAIAAALESKDKAVAAAFEASEKAIMKAEVSIEKRADATYVALGELQRLLTGLMPRAEAENRFGNQDGIIGDVKERVGRIESTKAGGNEARMAIYGLAAFLLVLLTIGGYLAGKS